MVKGRLTMAFDFAAKKGDKEHGKRSFCRDGKWTVVSYGPTYSNTYTIHEFDEAGLKWLQSIEVKETT